MNYIDSVSSSPAPTPTPTPILNVSSQPELANRTTDAAKKTFQILELNGQRMLVYVTETTAEGATFVREADDVSFEKLGQFVAPVLQGLAGRATHYQIEVKPEKIIVKTPTESLGEFNTDDLALNHPIQQSMAAYQSFIRHSNVIPAQGNPFQAPTPARTPAPIPPSTIPASATPAPSATDPTTPAAVPAQSVFDHMRTTLASSTQVDSQTVIGSMQVLLNQHPTSAIKIPFYKTNGGMTCLEARNDVPSEQQLADCTLEKMPSDKIFPHYLAIRRGTANSGHFVGIMIKSTGNNQYSLRYYDSKGESIDKYPEFADQFRRFLEKNNLEQGTNLTIELLSGHRDQDDTNDVDCGAFVVRDFEAELTGNARLRNTPIRDYRTDLANRVGNYPSTLWTQSSSEDPILTPVPACQYPTSAPTAAGRPGFLFSAENPIDLAKDDNDQLLICAAPRTVDGHTYGTATSNELRRRTNLSTLSTDRYLQHQAQLFLYRAPEGSFYSPLFPVPLNAIFTLPGDLLASDLSGNSLTPDAKQKLSNALYASLRFAKSQNKKKLVLPLPKLPAAARTENVRKEILEIYEKVFKLTEFENAFDSIVLTAPEEEESRVWNRTWEPTGSAPTPPATPTIAPNVAPDAMQSSCAIM